MKSRSFLIFIFLPVASATFLLVNGAFHDLSEPDDSMIVSDDIKISEVMTSNSSLFYDQFNETPDWIQLYNSGDSAIDLAGYSLTDDPDQPKK